MSTMLRNQFQDFFFQRLPFIDHVINDIYNTYPQKYREIFNVKTSRRAFENVAGMTSLGYLARYGEDEPVTYDKFYQGPSSQYIHIKMGLGVRTSMEAMQDDIDGILSGTARALGRSAAYAPEILAANVINDGETASTDANFTPPRSEALFTSSHSIPHAYDGGSSTYSNLGSSDFSITSLRSALNNMARIPDERGKLVRFTPQLLLGAPEMQYQFEEVLRSSKKSGTADNDLNAFQTLFDLTHMGWHFLTDYDAWYLRAKKSETDLNFFWRMPFKTDYDDDFDTGGMKTKIVGRFICGWSNWRGWYASTP